MASNQDKDSSHKGGTSNRGFASMDESRQRDIASKGDHAAHGRVLRTSSDSEEARETGKKDGQNSHGGSHSGGHGSHDYEDSSSATRGGSHEQHVKAGSQSHKNQESAVSSHSRGGSSEQHAETSR